jgi:hypothetical protein
MDLPSGLQIKKFFDFIGPISTTMFAEAHYWAIPPMGDSSGVSFMYM